MDVEHGATGIQSVQLIAIGKGQDLMGVKAGKEPVFWISQKKSSRLLMDQAPPETLIHGQSQVQVPGTQLAVLIASD